MKVTATLLIFGILNCHHISYMYAQSQRCTDELNKCSALATGTFEEGSVDSLCSSSLDMCIRDLDQLCTDSVSRQSVEALESFYAYSCTKQGMQDAASYGQCLSATGNCFSAYSNGLSSATTVSEICSKGHVNMFESCLTTRCSQAAGRFIKRTLKVIRSRIMCPGSASILHKADHILVITVLSFLLLKYLQ